jgi:hypothetical protein
MVALMTFSRPSIRKDRNGFGGIGWPLPDIRQGKEEMSGLSCVSLFSRSDCAELPRERLLFSHGIDPIERHLIIGLK